MPKFEPVAVGNITSHLYIQAWYFWQGAKQDFSDPGICSYKLDIIVLPCPIWYQSFIKQINKQAILLHSSSISENRIF